MIWSPTAPPRCWQPTTPGSEGKGRGRRQINRLRIGPSPPPPLPPAPTLSLETRDGGANYCYSFFANTHHHASSLARNARRRGLSLRSIPTPTTSPLHPPLAWNARRGNSLFSSYFLCCPIPCSKLEMAVLFFLFYFLHTELSWF